MGRAVVLVAIAVLVGILLLYRTGHGGGGTATVAATGTTTRTTTVKPSGSKTTVTSVLSTTTTTPARPASAVKVLVANGSSVRGLAGLTATRLHTAGYNTLAVVNATQQVTTSLVYYQPGYQLEGAAIGQLLGLAVTSVQAMASPPPVTNLSTANVLVVAGPDVARATTPTATTVHTATTLHTTTTVHLTTTTTVKH